MVTLQNGEKHAMRPMNVNTAVGGKQWVDWKIPDL
jgi:hypothetical protein